MNHVPAPDRTDFSREVQAYTQGLSERLRLLRSGERHPDLDDGLTVAMLAELEASTEELRVTEEELRVQSEELVEATWALEEERTRFRRIFDLAPEAMVTTDPVGTIREANRAAARLLGVAGDRLARKPLPAFLELSSTGPFRSYLARVASGESPDPVALQLRQRGGEVTSVRARAVPLAGQPARADELLWTVVAEGTAIAAAEQITGTEDARFLARAIARLNARLDVRHVATTTARMASGFFADYAVVDLIGPTGEPQREAAAHGDGRRQHVVDAILGPGSGAMSGGAVLQVAASGTALARENDARLGRALREPDDLPGELRPWAIAVHPLAADGVVHGVLTLVRTEPGVRPADGQGLLLRAFCGCAGTALGNARQLADTLEAARRAEEETQARRRTMAAISHEIRTPLHSILGYTQLLIDGVPQPIPQGSRRYLASISESARHLAGLVEDVLSLHRLEEAPQPLDLCEVPARDVLDESAGMLEDAARRAGLAFEVSAPPELRLRTDLSKLRQVLINLLGNAIKFTREGGVSAFAYESDANVVFVVRDTGPGIDPADVPHIFEPFWRGTAAADGSVDGAGLGLALVRTLVDRLGGDLQLETALGQGTTFRVVLPRNPES